MELIKLKEYITTRLEALTNLKVYDGVADDNPTFPYLVYSFPSPGTHTIRATRTDRIMEIDYWDDTNDDTALLNAAEDIKKGKTGPTVPGLNNSTQDEAEGFYKCYIEGDTWEVPEPDKDITHLKQTYILYIG